MSQRPGILTTVFRKAEGRWPLTKSPNQQPDVITAEIRLHWPYLAPPAEIKAALAEVYAKALLELDEKLDEGMWS